MPTAYVILGNANTRKSSTARALTGVARRKSVTVATNTGNIEIFVQISSLQESEIQPSDFVAEMNSGGYENVLVTLWVSERVTSSDTYPQGVDYLQVFIDDGWSIAYVVVLAASTFHGSPTGTPSPHFIPDSRTTPVNSIAAQIRDWWGWV
jgi:hypothetical protein